MQALSTMPQIVKQYALYQRNIRGRSAKTVEEYCLDLRTFFRFMKRFKGLEPVNRPIKDICVEDIDLAFIKNITTNDIFEFMNYVTDERNNISSTRQRKSSSLKGFFAYLTIHERLLIENPTETLSAPKKKKSLPKYLSLEQSIELLNAPEGVNKERDYCMLTIFLNCGLRLSELVGINMTDVISGTSSLRVLGKGNKERIVYLNDACFSAIEAYIKVRPKDHVKDKKALFLSSRLTRISPKTVQFIVNTCLAKIGLEGAGYSVHKLRHTAATLMYQYGGVDIRVLQDILGHENLGTTEIYTHLSSKQMEAAAKSNPLSSVKMKKDRESE
ncbi:MAG: tyrosine recombinase XerC [Oscillospiraceae bacterium]